MTEDVRVSRLAAVCFDVGGVLLHRDGRFISDVVWSRSGVRVEPRHCQEAFARADRQGVMTSDPSSFLASQEMRAAWAGHAGVGPEAIDDVWQALHADLGRLWGELDQDAVAVLEALTRRSVRLGAVSNAEGQLEEDLTRAELRHYFQALVDSARVGVRKPHPRIYEIALRELDVLPGECAFIGDTPTELVGARACGFRVSVLYDPHGVYGADQVPFPRAERLHAVLELLDRSSEA